jgi:hypothetical protein
MLVNPNKPNAEVKKDLRGTFIFVRLSYVPVYMQLPPIKSIAEFAHDPILADTLTASLFWNSSYAHHGLPFEAAKPRCLAE